MWDINGLVDKLQQVGAIEKRKRDITFTASFRNFLMRSLRGNMTIAESLEGWRIMLAQFHYSLSALTAEEIGATVVLLDYYFQNIKATANTPATAYSTGK